MSICLHTIDGTDCLVHGVPWCPAVLQMCVFDDNVFQMCRTCLRSVSSVSWCVTLSHFMCFMCCAHVCMCAQCGKCVTSVCTCVSLCYSMCYYVPDVFCWLVQCARCVTVCCAICGTVLPSVLTVFACVFALLYLLIQACRPRVS